MWAFKKSFSYYFMVLGLGLLLGLGSWLLWPVPMQGLRTQNPSRTRLMEIRQQQARKKHLPYRIHYLWVPYHQISPYLRQAVLAAEDDTFYQHPGLDFQALWFSLKHNWKHKRFAQGGSTLTQQVVKNLFLSPQKTVFRKLKEAALALRLEHTLSKQRIFEIYLNIAEWGQGIFGAEAAAQTYFGKSAAELSPDEALALAAVLPSPLRHSPVRQDSYLLWRKAWILKQLKPETHQPLTTPLAEISSSPLPEWVAEEESDGELEIAEPFNNTPTAQESPESHPTAPEPLSQTAE